MTFLARRLLTRPARRPATLAVTRLEDRTVPTGRPFPSPVIFVGGEGGPPPVVRAFDADTGTQLFERAVFEPTFTGGVRVAVADFTRDGYPDLVAAAGPGGGPRVRVLDGKTGQPVPGPLGSFFAYAPGFTGGVNVAAADVDGDGVPDVVTAAGPGGGPHVQAFSGKTGRVIRSFFAFDPDFRGGATVAAADFDGDGRAEVAVGAGAGGGPHVKVFDLLTGEPTPGPLGSFFAFDPADRGGVNVGADALAGDVDADGVPDLLVGSGPGGPARVKAYSGKTGAVLADFAPFAAGMTAGVRVAAAYVDDDKYADIVVASGAGSPTTVQAFSGKTLAPVPGPAADFRPFGAGDVGGAFVAASNDPVFPGMSAPEASLVLTTAGTRQDIMVRVLNAGGSEFGDSYTPTGAVRFDAVETTSGAEYDLGAGPVLPPDPGPSGLLVEGQAEAHVLAALPTGTYTVAARYSGDGAFAPMTTAAWIVVNPDDLPPSPQMVSVAAVVGTTAESGAGAGVVRFTRSGSPAAINGAGLTVRYDVTGTADRGFDYSMPEGQTVQFQPGQRVFDVPVWPLDDAEREWDETVGVVVRAGSGFVVGFPNTAVVTLVSDDGDPLPLDPPVAAADEATTDEDTPVVIDYLTYNDTQVAGATVTVAGVGTAGHGTVALGAGGVVTYTPAANWSGTDTFSYTAAVAVPGKAADPAYVSTATGVVTVTVRPVNDPPTAAVLSANAARNGSAAVTLAGADVEGSPLTFDLATPPAHGTLGPLDGGKLTYYPSGNFVGTDTFTYTASDGAASSAPATVTVTVSGGPLGAGVTVTPTGGATRVAEPGWLADGDGGDDYSVVLNTAPTADVTVTLAPDAHLAVDRPTLTFTPANWSVPQAVRVTAVADDAVDAGDTFPATIAHTAASADLAYNGVAVAGLAVQVADADIAAIAVEPAGTAADLTEAAPGVPYTVVLTSKPAATVTVALVPASGVTVSAATLTFTPANWDTPQTVTLTATNDTATQGYRTLGVAATGASSDPHYQGVDGSISVGVADDDAPNGYADAAATDRDQPVTFAVAGNDTNPLGGTLAVSSFTQPAHGTVTLGADGQFTYTPAVGWAGDDSFTYWVSAGGVPSNSTGVSVSVAATNRPPVVTNPGTQATAEDGSVSLQMQATDPDGDTGLIYTATGLPPGLALNAMTGKVWGWVDPLAAGFYSPTVTVSDLAGASSSVTFTWAVTNTNHAPYAYRQYNQFSRAGTNVFIQLPVASDIDLEGDCVVSVSGLPSGATFLGGAIAGQLSPDSAGAYRVAVTVTDGHGAASKSSFDWYVRGPADPMPPMASVSVGTPRQGEVIEPKSVLLSPAVPIASTVSFSYPPDPGAVFTVVLMVTDGRAALSKSVFDLSDGQSAAFTYTPTGVSQAPGDVVLKAIVAGRTTSVELLTNVGVKLPGKVRGDDTPDTMRNRVSVGDGNWGSYVGVAEVFPALRSIGTGPLFGVSRPADDDKYGNAAVPAADTLRADLIGRSILHVTGTVQTAPSLDASGQPDGLARNADQLRLKAILPGLNVLQHPVAPQEFVSTEVFNVGGIPIATILQAHEEPLGKEIGKDDKGNGVYAIGLIHKEIVSLLFDGGGKFLEYSEVIKRGNGQNWLHTQPFEGADDGHLNFHPINSQLADLLGFKKIAAPGQGQLDIEPLKQEIRDIIDEYKKSKPATYDERNQGYVFYNTATSKKPTKSSEAYTITFSGYMHYLEMGNMIGKVRNRTVNGYYLFLARYSAVIKPPLPKLQPGLLMTKIGTYIKGNIIHVMDLNQR